MGSGTGVWGKEGEGKERILQSIFNDGVTDSITWPSNKH